MGGRLPWGRSTSETTSVFSCDPPLRLRYPDPGAKELRALYPDDSLYPLAAFAYDIRPLDAMEHEQLHVGLFRVWPRAKGRTRTPASRALALELVEDFGATREEVAHILHPASKHGAEQVRQDIQLAKEEKERTREWEADTLADAAVWVSVGETELDELIRRGLLDRPDSRLVAPYPGAISTPEGPRIDPRWHYALVPERVALTTIAAEFSRVLEEEAADVPEELLARMEQAERDFREVTLDILQLQDERMEELLTNARVERLVGMLLKVRQPA